MDDVIQMKMEQVKKNEAFMQLLQNIFVHHKKLFLIHQKIIQQHETAESTEAQRSHSCAKNPSDHVNL